MKETEAAKLWREKDLHREVGVCGERERERKKRGAEIALVRETGRSTRKKSSLNAYGC